MDYYSEISSGERCFIVAEAGVNHNGSLKHAKKLVDAALESGADAVKFQTFKAEELVTDTARKAEYQKKDDDQEFQLEMLKKLELKDEEFKELADYSMKKGILFLSTPFDFQSANLLDDLGVPIFKVPSGEITNHALLAHIARKRRPIIMSTGMATLEEIGGAIKIVKGEENKEIVLLHCITSYPAKVEDMNLKAMESLRREFNLPVGLSDHSMGIHVPIAAAALGAVVIEKHFTLDRSLPGPDHMASLEPSELKDMVNYIRDIEKALGTGIKLPTPSELEMKKIARRSLVACMDIPEGTRITGDMITAKRPEGGLEPRHFQEILGKKAVTLIKKDDLLKKEMIEWE